MTQTATKSKSTSRYEVTTYGNHYGIFDHKTTDMGTAKGEILRTIGNDPEQLKFAQHVAKLLNQCPRPANVSTFRSRR